MRKVRIFQSSSEGHLERLLNEFFDDSSKNIVSIDYTHVVDRDNTERITAFVYYQNVVKKDTPSGVIDLRKEDLKQTDVGVAIGLLADKLEPCGLKTYLNGWFSATDKPEYTRSELIQACYDFRVFNQTIKQEGRTMSSSQWFDKHYPKKD